ncbi:hypothetical protein ACFOOK_26385 [Micromonospora krabiensis]|uniref:Uncharacterized protein n=1 Tax=Micromonospora krabiensis TaxID=307121 RepID=A0A1C3N5P7_9ACTN|nr:hypothetical protein [Micromonospora krabiensis]SBV27904.1 hypothetical protein GA0070620_3435 [Micromonospora krabiensis]
MASLLITELPDDVAQVVREVARYLEVRTEDLVVADHTHEELREGAYSIAYEGQYDWPFHFTEEVFRKTVDVPRDLFLEAGTGWFLAVYPPKED